MAENQWLLDESKPVDDKARRQMEQELAMIPKEIPGAEAPEVPNLAVRIHDVIIQDNKKWFGEADIRFDVLFVHGHGEADKPESFYSPGTFRFGRVKDKDRLPIDVSGLLVFYGKPVHFLDIFIMVSRDRKDSDDLAKLLTGQLKSAEFKAAFGTLLGLAVAAPQVAVVTASIGAAAVLGNMAYQLLQQATGNTIGLYRASWLQHRDKFGIGWHPQNESFNIKDLTFRYQILLDK